MAFKSTFAPEIDGKTIDVATVMGELCHGMIKGDDLPDGAHAAVSVELDCREREWISPDRAVILLIGTMGEIRGKALLHGRAFLVDVETRSRESRDMCTMFGRRPHTYGPHGEWPGRHVDEAERDGLVEEFQAAPRDSRDFIGYGLPGRGKEELAGLMGVLAKDIEKTQEILARAAPDQSLDRAISHIHEHYPKFADNK